MKIKDLNEIICNDCNKKFSNKYTLQKHIRENRCSNNKKEEDNEIIKNLKEQLKKAEKKAEKRDKEMRKQIKSFIKFIDTKTDLSSKSISTYNYIVLHYNDAPQIKSIIDIELFLLNGRKKEDIADIILYNYKEDTLYKYIGDLIVNTYRKEEPLQQSIWTSDPSRFTYIIKTVVKSISGWHVDKGGILVKEKIINPILSYITYIIQRFYDDGTKKINNKDPLIEDIHYFMMQITNAYELINHIESGKLSNEIIKYLASQFHINKLLRNNSSNILFLSNDKK
jgi:hypothetical protein